MPTEISPHIWHVQNFWEWLLALEEAGGLQHAQSFCSLARHLTDALSRNEIGLAYLSNLLQTSTQSPMKLSSIDNLLTSCEVLLNEWALDNIEPIQRPTADQSSAFLQSIAGEESALQLAQQLLFSVRFKPQTLDSMALQGSARRLQSPGNTHMALQGSSLPLSESHIQNIAASMQSAVQIYTVHDASGQKAWPFMGNPIMSDPIPGPMLQPREVSRGSVVMGGLLLAQQRTSPPSGMHRTELCSSRFATSLEMSCTGVPAGNVPVQLGGAESASQEQDVDVGLESGALPWFPGWPWRQLGKPAAGGANGGAPFGADSAYLPHSTLFSSKAVLQKELFYDTREGSDDLGARGKPYGFFPRNSRDMHDAFTVVFPVCSCLLST